MKQASYDDLLLENARLRSKIAELQSAQSQQLHTTEPPIPRISLTPPIFPSPSHPLDRHAILRYSRHLLCSELGNRPVLAQAALLQARVLVIGAGGLGCPVLLHLAAAGVGTLGTVDQDVVDVSNLPRQTLFDERHVGRSKARVAAQRVKEINGRCTAVAFDVTFQPSNALELCRGWDVVVDCSDNVATRYLCNDACVLLGLPCVSGAALRMEGQLTVYGWRGGPCYRCLYAQPPPAHSITNCNEGGVLNAVTGCIGALQAIETIKLIALQRANEAQERKADVDDEADGPPFACPDLDVLSGRLLCFDATTCSFRTVRLRPRSPHCTVCGPERRITLESLASHDYVTAEPLCATKPLRFNDDALAPVNVAPSADVRSVPPSALSAVLSGSGGSGWSAPCLVLDVRPSLQFDICRLPSSINIPLATLHSRMDELEAVVHALPRSTTDRSNGEAAPTVLVVCRRGVDSVRAVAVINEARAGKAATAPWTLLNVQGGLLSYAEDVDPTFPIY